MVRRSISYACCALCVRAYVCVFCLLCSEHIGVLNKCKCNCVRACVCVCLCVFVRVCVCLCIWDFGSSAACFCQVYFLLYALLALRLFPFSLGSR